ncbi:AAA family ATPase [Pelomyxa schiedti]|nr:AAA family ATPase [Pelomyxa schiedti]
MKPRRSPSSSSSPHLPSSPPPSHSRGAGLPTSKSTRVPSTPPSPSSFPAPKSSHTSSASSPRISNNHASPSRSSSSSSSNKHALDQQQQEQQQSSTKLEVKIARPDDPSGVAIIHPATMARMRVGYGDMLEVRGSFPGGGAGSKSSRRGGGGCDDGDGSGGGGCSWSGSSVVVPVACGNWLTQNCISMDIATCVKCDITPGEHALVELLAYPPCYSFSLTAKPLRELPDRLKDTPIGDFVGAALYSQVLPQSGTTVSVPILAQKIPFRIENSLPAFEEQQAFVVLPDATITITTDGDLPPSNATQHPQEQTSGSPMIPQSREQLTAFSAIAGLDNEIQVMRDLVEMPLLHSELFPKLGVRPPKGVLLYGPPGTGKTLLAHSTAVHCGVKLFSVSGSETMSKYVGESEAKLRAIFSSAAQNAPSIVLLDEIDSLCPKRDQATNEVERRVVSTLLTLMDGVKPAARVVVIATTNRLDTVDLALRRAGRFDRELEISVPNKRARQSILELLLHDTPHTLTPDEIVQLAAGTHGFVGADLRALCNEAAMFAIRRRKNHAQAARDAKENTLQVTLDDFIAGKAIIRPSAMREVLIDVPNVRWSDIGGHDSIKQQLTEVIDWPIKHAEAFMRMGIKPPSGVLLYGPPGCSKTLLAQALATESHLNFIAVKGPQLLKKYVGESEKAISDVFKKARQNAPSILFFDELDGMFGSERGVTAVNDRIMSQMLVEMDGVQTLRGVAVVAATNRPDLVDAALLRPGRIDRVLYVGPPDLQSREAILKIHLAKTPCSPSVDLHQLAVITEGYSGAELAGLCRSAAILAIRSSLEATQVEESHFKAALAAMDPPQITPSMVTQFRSFGAHHT